ncbi:MAG: HD domain-containing protein [Pirellulaceae bacterium]|nr:HD domain-containing protein [Planctomycetales bacterium]MCA9222123.1 HD domain-containing protein [Planctomycetales bacterium]
MSHTTEIVSLFEQRGDSQYGGEAVSQLEHALQAAMLAERESASAELIVAALLHDVGHLLHDMPADAPDSGIDDHHENSAAHYLRTRFPEAVVEPVRLHVAAKRYLCTVDSEYHRTLSRPSIVSLQLQGGPMSAEERADFEANPFWRDAVRLRHWDDMAKTPQLPTPSLSHFASYIAAVAFKEP